MAFQVGDQIAHPMHGAGVIDRIESKRINGIERDYYVLRIPVGDMLVMVPTDGCEEIGIRPIIDRETAQRIVAAMPEIVVNMTSNWNKRYRENMLRIKSGDLMEVAHVIKGLMEREREKGLSTGERKMLHSAKQILISEIVLAEESSYTQVEERINKALA